MFVLRLSWAQSLAVNPGIVGLMISVLTANPADAAWGKTSSMVVSATVQASCSLALSNLNFGVYTGVQKDAETSLTVICTSTTPYTVGLFAGTTTGATVANRMMTGAGDTTYHYELYSNSDRSQAWGTTVGVDTVGGTGTGSYQTLTVYGRLPALQFVTPGMYTDSITATIAY